MHARAPFAPGLDSSRLRTGCCRVRVVVVVAGQSDAILVRHQFSMGEAEVVNPLWEKLKPHYTPFFTRDELVDFFARMGGMVGMSLSAAAVEVAYRLTGGHKYLSRRLGSKLLAQMGQAVALEIDADEMRRAMEPLLVDGDQYLGALFERMPERAQAIVARLAADQPVPAQGNSAALSFLLSYSLVIRDGSTYRLSMGLLAEWVMRSRIPGQPREQAPPPHSPGPAGKSAPKAGETVTTTVEPTADEVETPDPPPEPNPRITVPGEALRPGAAPGAAAVRIEVFISYSHIDNAFRVELEGHLSVLRRLDMVAVWHDGRLSPGVEWREAIRKQLQRADIIVLLVSKDFLVRLLLFEGDAASHAASPGPPGRRHPGADPGL
jgi:hypothetical protein